MNNPNISLFQISLGITVLVHLVLLNNVGQGLFNLNFYCTGSKIDPRLCQSCREQAFCALDFFFSKSHPRSCGRTAQYRNLAK